jgi:hypothetical protein
MENTKLMLILKWAIYIDVPISFITLFFLYTEYVSLGGMILLLIFSVFYLHLKVTSKKIMCKNCGKKVIQLPISPIRFLWELIKTRQLPDPYFWVHRQSESSFCHSTIAEPDIEVK